MTRKKRVIGIVTARGGSKGVPRKNVRDLAGKPLLAWTIQAAKEAKLLDRVVLSSEDPEIISVAEGLGCEVPFVRPAELSRDDTPGIDPIIHALELLPEYDYAVLLQPTSPLRTAEDIDGAISSCWSSGAPACVSVCESQENPYWMYSLEASTGFMRPLLTPQKAYSRRQDLPKFYTINGAVYVGERLALLKERTFLTSKTVAFVMPSPRSLDIDTEFDFEMANLMMKKLV